MYFFCFPLNISKIVITGIYLIDNKLRRKFWKQKEFLELIKLKNLFLNDFLAS